MDLDIGSSIDGINEMMHFFMLQEYNADKILLWFCMLRIRSSVQ